MRLLIQDSPGEMLFAILMAASPIIGSFWVDPAVTRWIVFGVGVAMTAVTVAVALKPVRRGGPAG
jgi:hypothetical protein